MASIRITINTDGAAFQNDDPLGVNCPREIARILLAVVDRLDDISGFDSDCDRDVRDLHEMVLRDLNDNVVGKVEVID